MTTTAVAQGPLGDAALWDQLAVPGVARDEALARIVVSCRNYLLLVADKRLPHDVRAKVAASDILQETYLEARRDFQHFQGSTERELLAWLCQILLNNVRDSSRKFQSRQKRAVSREVPLVPGSSADNAIAATETPSKVISGREETHRLQIALAQLSEEYRQVVVLRSLERLPLADVAQIMGRSDEAVRKLWVRAIRQLRRLMAADGRNSDRS